MKKTKLFILPALALILCPAAWPAQEPAVKEFNGKDIKSIEVGTEAGDIKLLPSKGMVKVETVRSDDACRITIMPEGSSLRVEAESADKSRGLLKMLERKTCRTGFNVYLPGNIALKARSVSGNISVSAAAAGADIYSVSGDISFEASGSDVELETVSGDMKGRFCGAGLSVKTVSGDANISGLCSGADAKSVSGDISLGWEKLPDSGSAYIKTVSGDADIVLPAGASAVLVHEAVAGTSRSVVGGGSDSGFIIRMKTVSGGLSGPGKTEPDSPSSLSGAPANGFTHRHHGDRQNQRGGDKQYFKLAVALGMSFFILVIALFMKTNIEAVSLEIRGEFYKSCAAGAAMTIAFVPVLLLLVVSIAGILIIPFFIVLTSVAVALGFAGFLHALSLRLCGELNRPMPGTIKAVMLGYAIVIIPWIMLPAMSCVPGAIGMLGWILRFGITAIMLFGGMAGFGAVWLSRMGGLLEPGRWRGTKAKDSDAGKPA